MNSILERVNLVCQTVRRLNPGPITFKKLVGSTKTVFKINDIDLKLKTEKDKTIGADHFYIIAYYDPDDDFNDEPAIEVVVYHNFEKTAAFQKNQITDFLVQVYDAVVHELRHQHQSRKRGFETYSNHDTEPYSKYLSDPDEIDAYAFSIAIELLRSMPMIRAKRYMGKITSLSKLNKNGNLVSPNLNSYVSHFKKDNLIKKLSKKIVKHLDHIDINYIFK